MTTLRITPYVPGGTHRTGTLREVDEAVITAAVGFAPNVADDPCKVTASWGFKVSMPDGTEHVCAVWDWKGSFEQGGASCFGDPNVLRLVFGEHRVCASNWGEQPWLKH